MGVSDHNATGGWIAGEVTRGPFRSDESGVSVKTAPFLRCRSVTISALSAARRDTVKLQIGGWMLDERQFFLMASEQMMRDGQSVRDAGDASPLRLTLF